MENEHTIEAGETALISLYDGDTEEGLKLLRFRRLCEKVTRSTSHVEPQTLPPTSAAANFQSPGVLSNIGME